MYYAWSILGTICLCFRCNCLDISCFSNDTTHAERGAGEDSTDGEGAQQADAGATGQGEREAQAGAQTGNGEYVQNSSE